MYASGRPNILNMVRLPALLLLLVAAAALPVQAQIQPRSLQAVDDPEGEFSISVRRGGKVKVSFQGLGTLATRNDIGDSGESTVNRLYDDGYVLFDGRTTSTGERLPDDGKTNSWRYAFDEQVIDEDGDGVGDGIAFHRYETRSNGTPLDVESSPALGVDLDYSYAFGQFGGRLRNKSPRATWGGMVGLSVTSFNAKTNDTIQATLFSVTDRYSLDGATPPGAPYQAPSTSTVPGIDSAVDTTTLLANRPYLREYVDDGVADVTGFWQVRGASFTARAGLWARYRPLERVGIRASAGMSVSHVGLRMRYDEWLDREDIISQLRYRNELQPDKWTYFGAYGSLDLEFWLTPSTSLFAGATYEKLDKDKEITLDGRTADVEFSSGTGFRIGITKLF